MKISGDKPYVLQTYVKKVGKREKIAQGEGSEKNSSKIDRVDISTKARQKDIKRVKELLEKVPDVREEKVAALKTAIEKKTYDVKGNEIAEKMIKQSVDESV